MATEPPRVVRIIEEEGREFYYQLGLSIVTWAHIDEELFDVCAAILKSEERHAAAAYYQSPSLGTRLSLVDELVKTVLPAREKREGAHAHPTEKRWTALLKGIREELHTRNHLAHSPTTPVVEPRAAEGDRPAGHYLWFISHVSRGERLRARSADKRSLRLEDVRHHRDKIERLLSHLTFFRERVLPGLL